MHTFTPTHTHTHTHTHTQRDTCTHACSHIQTDFYKFSAIKNLVCAIYISKLKFQIPNSHEYKNVVNGNEANNAIKAEKEETKDISIEFKTGSDERRKHHTVKLRGPI